MNLIEELRQANPFADPEGCARLMERAANELAGNEALRKDAERYRWLRECRGIKVPLTGGTKNWQWVFLDDTDAAIDAALAARGGHMTSALVERLKAKDAAITGTLEPVRERLPDLIAALRAYRQADEDGVMVLVSRQACEEAADALRLLERGNAENA